MKRILSLLCLLPSLLMGATGDITSVVIRPDGWSAEITVEGFTTGASYDFDLDSTATQDGIPSATTPYFTVVSEGYNNAGTLGTTTRTVYATSVVRVPYATRTQAGGTWANTFTDGEAITCSTSGATAVVVGNQSAGTVLRYKQLSGTPLTTQTWSGATATFVNTSDTVTTLTVPTNDELNNGTGLVFRVSLSEPIFIDDNTGAGKSGTAPTCTLKAGFVTNTGGASQTSAAYTAGVVTNNSTATYSEVITIANWTIPPRQLITGTSFAFRVSAWQYFGKEKHPVACVKFTITDESTNTATATVTDLTWTKSEYGDLGPPIQEYIATIDLSGLDDAEILSCRFQAYPWVGDITAVRDSADGPAQPTPLASNITMFYDESGTYERRVAVVDSTNGNDGTGTTVALADFDSGSPPAAYLDIESAAEGLDAAMTRSDIGGCYIYLRDNSAHAWTGGVVTASARNTYVTVKTFPLDTRASLTSNSGTANLGTGYPIKLEDVNIAPAVHSMFSAVDYFWMDDVDVNDTTIRTWTQCDLLFFTRCTFTQCNQDPGPYSTETTSAALVRGCKIMAGWNDDFSVPFVFIGNKTDGFITNTVSILCRGDTSTSTGIPNPNNVIWCFNDLRMSDCLAFRPGASSNRTFATNGVAIVGNLVERTASAGGATSLSTGTDTGDDITNMLIWNNTFADFKHNIFYNDPAGSVPVFRFCTYKNNIIADYNLKADDFNSDGRGINAWMEYYGVGFSSNLMAERTSSGAPQNYLNMFYGLNTDTAGGSAAINPLYVTDASIAVAGAGNGDYRLRTTSPAYRLQRDCLLPYDITGKPRSANNDSAGAYAEGGVRPASMFFSN